MAIKPKLQSLLASANSVTGEERETLTEAVQDLVDGYGQGGNDIILPTQLNLYNELKMFEISNNPADYTKVDWVENTGTQYIMTSYYYNAHTKLVFTLQCTNTTNGWSGNFQGNGYNLLYGISGSSKWNFYFGSSELNNISADTNKHIFTLNDENGNWYVDDVLVGHINRTFSGSTSVPLILMMTYRSASNINDSRFGQWGTFKAYDDNGLGLHLEPCYHTATGITGMFDVVTNTFCGSAGLLIPSDTSNEINLATYLNSLGGN